MNAKRILIVLAALHTALAVLYALETPYRTGGRLRFQSGAYAKDIGAPDERQHANYVAKLANGEGLQKLDPNDPNLYENYQAHQPPLYYGLAAGLLKTTGLTDPESRSTGLALRFMNAATGAATVFGAFFLVLWGFKNEDWALAAAAVVALLPMNLALSGAAGNDPLLFALCTWCLAYLARAVRDGWCAGLALKAGLFAGLAILTKTSAIALLPAMALSFVPLLELKAKIRWGSVLIAFGLALGLAAPWWIRNMSLYGDPLALGAFSAAFKGSPQASAFIFGKEFQPGVVMPPIGHLDYWSGLNTSGANTPHVGVAWWTLRSFFGVFGYMDIFLPGALYGVLIAGLLALLAGRARLSGVEALKQSRGVRIVLGAFWIIVLAQFIRFNAQYFQGQARYLFPAIGPIAATLGIGACGLSTKRPRVGVFALAAVLLALNAYVLWTLPPEFGRRVAPEPSASRELPETSTV